MGDFREWEKAEFWGEGWGVLRERNLPDPWTLALRNRDLARSVRRWGKMWDETAQSWDERARELFERVGHGEKLALLARLLFPHLCRSGFSAMHWHLLEEEGRWLGAKKDRGRRWALAAPRGHAKSTLGSLILPLVELGLGRQPYVVLLSATVGQAASRLSNLRRELEANRRLRGAWPRLQARGTPWSKRALGLDSCYVESYGALSEIRGLNQGGARPSLIILDDTDSTNRVRSHSQREQLLSWFDEVVEPLGDRSTDIVVLGTVLHGESLLASLLRRPTWDGTLWRALESWPRAGYLWSQWMTLLTTPGEDGAEGIARDFFRLHRREMLEGARALWPQRDSVEDLYRLMAVQGLGAFRKEKQNDPTPQEGGPWIPHRWLRFVVRRDRLVLLGFEQEGEKGGSAQEGPRLEELAFYGYLDPATGRGGKRQDYSALATVARGPGEDPVYYLMEVWMERASLEEQVKQVAEASVRWGWVGFAYEANGFQALLGPELGKGLREMARRVGSVAVVPRAVTHHQPKALRIERAGLLVAGQRLWFHGHLAGSFVQQAMDYPHAASHDDGLDAVAGALELAKLQSGLAFGIRTVSRDRR